MWHSLGEQITFEFDSNLDAFTIVISVKHCPLSVSCTNSQNARLLYLLQEVPPNHNTDICARTGTVPRLHEFELHAFTDNANDGSHSHCVARTRPALLLIGVRYM